MPESIALIVGGSGAAGQSAIQAFHEDRNDSDRNWRIIATTSGEDSVQGADKTLKHIGLEDADDAILKIIEALKTEDPVDVLVYTPARGNLGYPVSQTPEEDIEEGLKFCYDPMLELEKKLCPRLTIGYSAFYYLPHLLMFYGSLAFIKKKMEDWALEKPDSRKVIRAGTFFSQSVRGISLILQRLAKSSPHAELQKLLEEQKASGKKFPDFFLEYIAAKEKQSYESDFPNLAYRMTEPKDLKEALLKILKGEPAPIVSLIGAWVWTEDKLPAMPEYLRKR
ncbi:SDR family NAD(P)-dependent oxidoreductase [Leptospira fluminis]|uniref:SDR family NAD(P)-dependent oxidoreductase n=1 Tax=Leptospira fluminis TaxID=2484979 RepID=A0A4R9GU00_9LEPT|nr:SDR family NAD(P)-dependent oxidoreductase [Leptospira fluminis]TGK21901.1 SDR family NAD(P)-dependent oxidoreductase [Leptospira fluminis]